MDEEGGPRTPSTRLHKVGAVAEITGLPAHVLRYWETEFPFLEPGKTRGGQRLYTADDIDLILRIKELVHEQGFTIAGARRRLQRERNVEGDEAMDGVADVLDYVRHELRAILTLIEADDKQ
jgi:DNA-binding transcriptional MerR regulator